LVVLRIRVLLTLVGLYVQKVLVVALAVFILRL
jgi:hypothetical protein